MGMWSNAMGRHTRAISGPRDRAGAPAVPALLALASGTSALIFQVLWIKQLSLIVGVEVYAITVAVAAFFAGLALGGVVLGRRADRAGRPLRFYALLEAGVAVLCIAATLVLARVAPVFAWLEVRGA